MKKKLKTPMSVISAFLGFLMLESCFVLPISVSPGVTAYADTVPSGFTAVSAAEDLELIRSDPFGKFILTSDIDLSETRRGGSMDKGNGWTPIEKFAGTLDGNGHAITNMTIYGDVKKAGLFATNLGTITNVHMKDVNIEITTDLSDSVNCGALCAYSSHDLDRCSSTGTVKAAAFITSSDSNDFDVGGLVGRCDAKISKSYSCASVEYGFYYEKADAFVNNFFEPYVGGVAGTASCDDCYNRGSVRGVGYRSFFDISGDSFADFKVSKQKLHAGGISGVGEYNRCLNYADGKISGYEYATAWYCYYNSSATFGYPGSRSGTLTGLSEQKNLYDGLDPAVWEYINGEDQLIDNPEFPLIDVSFAKKPEKLNFAPGDIFECDGVLLISYNGGYSRQIPVTPDMTSGYDLSSEGDQTVSVSYRGFTLHYTISVSSVHPTGILLDRYSMELNRGQSMQLTASVTPANVSNSKITWTSSDTSVAVVDENGLVTSVGAGTVDITAETENGISAVCRLNSFIDANSMWFDIKETTVNIGETINNAPKFDPPDSAPKLSWRVVNASPYGCVKVDQNGNVTGVTPGGSAEIKCESSWAGLSDPNKQWVVPPYASYKVSVTSHAFDLSLSNEKLSVTVGQQFDISCRALPDDMTDTISISFTGNLFTQVENGMTGKNNAHIRLIADRAGKSAIIFKTSNGIEKTCEVTVTDPDIADAVFTPEYKKTLYNGSEKTPYVSGTYNGNYLQEGVDYSVTYKNNTNVGIATIEIKGMNKYIGSQTLKFLIYDISSCSMTLAEDFYIYDGLAKRPAVMLYDNSKVLAEGVDFRAAYSNNVNPGTAYVTVTGINDYTGTKTMTYTISKEGRVDMSNCDIAIDPTAFIYDGGEKRTSITVYNGHNLLVKDKDYTVTYFDNINIGTARAVVMGIGSYTGTREMTYSINAAPIKEISGCTITLSQTSFEYDGTEKRPGVTVKNGALKLSEGADYSVSYSNNTEPGTASVTVSGMGGYKGKVDLAFTIRKKPEPQSDTDSETKPKKENFIWGVDNWNFLNNSKVGHFTNDTYRSQINDTYKDILAQNLTNSEYQTIFIGVGKQKAWLDDIFQGSCYGMSSTTLLAKEGLFPFSEYQSGASKLHDFDYPAKNGTTNPSYTKNISSLITYYQMLQVKDVTQQKYRSYPNKSNSDIIKEIISLLDTNNTVVIGFKKDNWGGHAILGYGYEFGSYNKNGVDYQGRIKICDPNSSTTNDENYYIYFTTTTYDWAIPAYSYANMSSKNGAVFNCVSADINEINQGGYLSGSATKQASSDYITRMDVYSISNERSVTKVQENGSGSYSMINNAPGDIEEDYSYVLGGESEGIIGYNLYDKDASYRVVQTGGEALDLSIRYDDCLMTGSSQNGKSVTFDKSGCVEVKGENSDFAVSMTLNNGSPTDWFTVKASGKNSDSVTLKTAENGWVISGDNLENVKVSANNKYCEAYTEFTTEYDSALIYEIDQNTIGIAIDADGNGTFETTIKPDPCTEPVIPPEPSDNGIFGDIDEDGTITSSDALLILRMSVGLQDYGAEIIALADIDGDGILTSSDALEILRYSVGLSQNNKIGVPSGTDGRQVARF